MPQLTRITPHSGAWRCLRCPYQAKVMKMLEMVSRMMVVMRSHYPIASSSADSRGVPQRRQITAEQSPQVSGSVTSTAQFGQYKLSLPLLDFASPLATQRG